MSHVRCRCTRCADAQVEQVIVRTLESKPAVAKHWATRAMAEAAGENQTVISRIWRAFSIRLSRQESFEAQTRSAFIDRVCNMVELYSSLE